MTSDRNERTRLAKQHERNIRINILAQFCCIACKESDPDLIDWHHVNPNEKEFGVGSQMSLAHDRWWLEVLKCVPLCCNCHRKIHKDKLCLLPIHL
jgi:hypothetical protein